MRLFDNESMFNKETQEWEEFYSINGLEVDVDTFSEQAEIEELATEDDIIDENCKCCNCDYRCADFNCTCGEDHEVENGNMYEEVIQCDCPDCVEERRLEQEEECDCPECQGDRLTDMALDSIMSTGGCYDCIGEILMHFREDMETIGWNSHRDYITEMNAE